MKKEFPSKCPRCDHVEWFYTKDGANNHDEQRKERLPLLPFLPHKHPLPDFFDDMVAAKQWQRYFGGVSI